MKKNILIGLIFLSTKVLVGQSVIDGFKCRYLTGLETSIIALPTNWNEQPARCDVKTIKFCSTPIVCEKEGARPRYSVSICRPLDDGRCPPQDVCGADEPEGSGETTTTIAPKESAPVQRRLEEISQQQKQHSGKRQR